MHLAGQRFGVIFKGLLIVALAVSPVTLAPVGPSTAQAMAVMAAMVQYTQVATIPLPGKGGHGDWVTYDPATNSVYVALHESGVAVIDAGANKVVADIDPIPGPNGIAYDSGYLYVAAGDSNELVVVSKGDWKIVGRVKTKGTSPDGIWVPDLGRIVVASDDNNWVEVYSAGATPRLLNTISLLPANPKTGPDVGLYVAAKGKLYMPVDALVEVVDVKTGKIGAWVDTGVPLTKNGGTKNMIYDQTKNLLWVGTTANKVLILDADTLGVTGSVPAHGGIDQVSFDPEKRFVYTFESSAKGFDVFNADTRLPVAYVNTGSGNTHTGDVNPTTHTVYVYEGDANVVAVYAPAL
jgi:YVTN family beta-propeller protein